MSDLEVKGDVGGALSAAEAAGLSDQIATLARAGLPLGPGLAALGEEFPDGRFRRTLGALAESLERGVPLDQAIDDQKSRIPAHLRGLVVGGLRSGRLGDILGRFSTYASVGNELKQKLWLSMAYPLVSMAVALAIFVFVHVVLVAQFEVMFRDFGVPLPRLTIAMLAVSHGLRNGWSALPFLAASILVLYVLARLFLKASTRRSLAMRIPLLGGVWRYTSWAEYCHLLALLLESHLPMPEALRLTGEGVQNDRLERNSRDMAMDVEKGVPLSESMAARCDFPSGLPRLLRWADGEKATAEILHIVGEMFEARARSQATFAGTVMAVVSVIMIIWGVFTVIGGLMLPMVTLLHALSG